MASSFLFDTAKAGLHNGLLPSWSAPGSSYFLTLVTASYVPSEGHSYMSNLSGYELSSPSYTAGYNGTMRLALSGRSIFSNTVSHQAEFRASAVSYAGLSAGTAAAYVIAQQAGSDGNSPLVVYCSTGGFPLVTNGGDVSITFANSGVFQLKDA